MGVSNTIFIVTLFAQRTTFLIKCYLKPEQFHSALGFVKRMLATIIQVGPTLSLALPMCLYGSGSQPFGTQGPLTNFVSWLQTTTENCAMEKISPFVCLYPYKIK